MLSVAQTVLLGIIELLMNFKEAEGSGCGQFKVQLLSLLLHGGTEENHKKRLATVTK
jgi:hypothetical protein